MVAIHPSCDLLVVLSLRHYTAPPCSKCSICADRCFMFGLPSNDPVINALKGDKMDVFLWKQATPGEKLTKDAKKDGSESLTLGMWISQADASYEV